jgi:outer membrane receptor for Fe3+-dicitrate
MFRTIQIRFPGIAERPTCSCTQDFNHLERYGINPYGLNIESGYLRDTIEFSRALQFTVGTRFDRFEVENIFTKGYWASADGNNNISPGQGRTVPLQASYRF